MGEQQFVRLRVELNRESQTQSEKRLTRERARRFETGMPLATAPNQRKGAADGSQLSASQTTAAAAGRAGTEIIIKEYYNITSQRKVLHKFCRSIMAEFLQLIWSVAP